MKKDKPKIGPAYAMKLLSRPWWPNDVEEVARCLRGMVDLVESMERHGSSQALPPKQWSGPRPSEGDLGPIEAAYLHHARRTWGEATQMEEVEDSYFHFRAGYEAATGSTQAGQQWKLVAYRSKRNAAKQKVWFYSEIDPSDIQPDKGGVVEALYIPQPPTQERKP